MLLPQVMVGRERHEGGGPGGLFRLDRLPDCLPELTEAYRGAVRLIYMDPPYLTGQQFSMRVRVGEDEWKRGRGSLDLKTYRDARDRDGWLSTMREVLAASREMLADDGMIFLHVDYRAHPYLRLLADEIFGEENFLNEIIWAYQTGGRSLTHFSRKHDVILFYRKTDHPDFHIEDVMTVPTAPRTNHMKRHVDPDGRVYRSIRANGREYAYYDDEPVAPSDVWNDLPHLHQRDPERTGYDTQKPLALLDRIVRCASREGDLVADLFAGSLTTLEAAQRNGRRFLGVDACRLSLNIARRRLRGGGYELAFEPAGDEAPCEVSAQPQIGFLRVCLEKFTVDESVYGRAFAGLDAVDSWSVGYLVDGAYQCQDESVRTARQPALSGALNLPVYQGEAAVCVNDVGGRSFYYRLPVEKFTQA